MLTQNRQSAYVYRLFNHGYVWTIFYNGGSFASNLPNVCRVMTTKLGFNLKEIEFAVLEINNRFHNCAEFNTFKSFVFTYDTYELGNKIVNQ